MAIFYKYHIQIYRENGSVSNCVQKYSGDVSPTRCLSRGFAAMAQLIWPDDRSFLIEIKEKISGIPVYRIFRALPFLE